MAYLDKYTGTWDAEKAKHLLNRTTFGPSTQMVDQALVLGLDGTVDKLLEELPAPSPPVKSIPDGTGRNQLDDPGAVYGETWVNADPFPNINPPMLRNRVLRSRSKSLYSWTILQIFETGINIREKMTLFWHNHFVVGDSVIPSREYVYAETLRRHAVGNFKELTKDITIDTNMLIYLSGATNTSHAPNENYSRELLELFTIGKGALAGPGDYTNYTEEDVITMAKILTGWRVPRISGIDTLTAEFDNNLHTQGSKTLSHRFDNETIFQNGPNEYKGLIDVIFKKKECAKFICRKLYRWFVSPRWDSSIEENVIDPLADILYNNDYEVSSVLRILMSSDIFYESTKCMIKSPMDLLLSSSRGFGIDDMGADIGEIYDKAYNYYIMSGDIEQLLFFHPDVAGWKAYYQEPQLDRLWINNLLLPKRHEFCQLMVEGGRFSYNDVNYTISDTIPVLDFVADVPNARDPNQLIIGIAEWMFNYPLQSSQIDSLKEILIPGLPDFEWTVEYSDYLSDPTNPDLKDGVENKLKSLFSVMVRMSEFQIM